MPKVRRLSVALATMALLTFVASPAAAMKAQDPVGDVPGPLDIEEVSLVWDDTKVTGKIVMASAFDPTLLTGGGGSVQAAILTRKSDASYLYSHRIFIMKEDGGDLWGWMTRWRADEVDPEYDGPVKVSMPNDQTVKFVVKRAVIAGDKEDSKFAFWFLTAYSDFEDEACLPTSGGCVDYAPDGDGMFVRRW